MEDAEPELPGGELDKTVLMEGGLREGETWFALTLLEDEDVEELVLMTLGRGFKVAEVIICIESKERASEE